MNIVNIYDEQYLLATERVIAPCEGKSPKRGCVYAYGMDCGG